MQDIATLLGRAFNKGNITEVKDVISLWQNSLYEQSQNQLSSIYDSRSNFAENGAYSLGLRLRDSQGKELAGVTIKFDVDKGTVTWSQGL